MIGHMSIKSFPYIVNEGVWITSATTTTPSGNMTQKPQNGDIAFLCMAGANANISAPPTGWTILGSAYSNPLCAVMYKICDGTEGTSISLTLTANVTSNGYGFMLRNVSASPIGNAAGATSGGANAASLATANINVSAGSLVLIWNVGTGAIVSASNSFTMFFQNATNTGALFFKWYASSATSQGSTVVNGTGDRHRNNIFEIKLAA